MVHFWLIMVTRILKLNAVLSFWDILGMDLYVCAVGLEEQELLKSYIRGTHTLRDRL